MTFCVFDDIGRIQHFFFEVGLEVYCVKCGTLHVGWHELDINDNFKIL